MQRILTTLLLFCGCGYAMAQTERINFKGDKLYPEGTAYHPAGKFFFVSSVTTGTIGKVDEKGNYTVFHADQGLKSSYGMKVDLKRNKLWVCIGDATQSMYSEPGTYKKLIRLIGLDLSSGSRVNDIDLSSLVPGEHYANDLVLDDAGNIYITDSYAAVIYKVDTLGKPVVFCKNDLFKSIDVGLNGIIFHPDGFLIVAHNTNGALYKVSISNPALVEKVTVPTFFPGADGLLLKDKNTLYLVQNKGTNKIFEVTSKDGWRTASVTSGTKLVDRFDNPTTLTRYNGKVYALNAKLNKLSDPVEVPASEFSLQLVRMHPIR